MRLEDWLKALGREVRKLRGNEKQEAFADRCGITREMLGVIENGGYPESRKKKSGEGAYYGIEALAKVLMNAMSATSAFEVLSGKAHDLTHQHAEVHRLLQELLDADGDWPSHATVNVESVHDRWVKLRSKSGEHPKKGQKKAQKRSSPSVPDQSSFPS